MRGCGLTLTVTAIPGLPDIQPGDDLARLLVDRIAKSGHVLGDGDVIVLSQKIVSKSEGRYALLADAVIDDDVTRIAEACGKDARFVSIVLGETDRIVRTGPNVLIVRNRLGLVMANAGIDQSNIDQAEKHVLLLPEDPDKSADAIRSRLTLLTGTSVGVVIADSSGRAWRNGVVGLCIGCSGIDALADRRGDIDRFGNELKVTFVAVADMIASAATLVLGEGAEGVPAVIVSGVDPRWLTDGNGAGARDLVRPIAQDLFL